MEDEKPAIAEETMPAQAETPAEETPQETPQAEEPTNAESIEIIERFAPGEDTSTPQAIIAAQLKVLQKMIPMYDAFYDVAMTSPEAAAFMSDLKDTADPVTALIANYEHEEVQAALDSWNDESYEGAKTRFAEKNTQRKARESELEANKEKSQVSAQEFVDKYQQTDEELEEFRAFFESIFKDMMDNNMTVDHWERMWKAFKFDGTVAELETKAVEAEENGRIAGRNEQIATGKKSRKELIAELPEIGAGAAMPPRPEKPKSFAQEFMNGAL